MVAYSFKPRFVGPIQLGLGLQVDHHPGDGHILRPKRQTIRSIGRRRHAMAGQQLQLYTGMRTANCRKIGDAVCTETRPITIEVRQTGLRIMLGSSGIALKSRFAEELALNDGFRDPVEMHAFWLEEHGLGWFHGVLIKWVPFLPGPREQGAPT